nr:MAG TPA: hypothetical protein [Microviridae sp.]
MEVYLPNFGRSSHNIGKINEKNIRRRQTPERKQNGSIPA